MLEQQIMLKLQPWPLKLVKLLKLPVWPTWKLYKDTAQIVVITVQPQVISTKASMSNSSQNLLKKKRLPSLKNYFLEMLLLYYLMAKFTLETSFWK